MAERIAAGDEGRSRFARIVNEPRTFTAATATWLFLIAGIAIRLAEYGLDREYYGDERYVSRNIVGRAPFDFSKPLSDDQLVPPGFLVVERLVSGVLGGSRRALRLLPLVCGIAGLFLMRRVAQRVLDQRAVPMAVGLFAIADDLVYYSTELKQYSTDMAVALICVAMGLRLERGGRALGGAMIGVAATWFSHPSAFVLAAVGTWLIGAAAARRDWIRVAALAGMAGAWAASFAGCYAVSLKLLDPGPFMWVWWGFAFLPIPPTTLAQAEQVGWSIANVFVYPVGILTPLGPMADAGVGLGLFGLGAWALGRSRPGALAMLAGPLVIALAASGLHKYPFHGRLLYFAVPGLVLVIAAGLEAIGRRVGWGVARAVVAFLLFMPAVVIADHWVHTRSRPFDSHGDLRNDLLDDLEKRRIWPRPVRGLIRAPGAVE